MCHASAPAVAASGSTSSTEYESTYEAGRHGVVADFERGERRRW